MSTRVKASQWGNSIAVRLPRRAVEALGLSAGQEMEIEVRGRTVELTMPKPRTEPVTIDWILSEMDRLGPKAAPETVEWGPDVGSEIIDDDWSPA